MNKTCLGQQGLRPDDVATTALEEYVGRMTHFASIGGAKSQFALQVHFQ